MASSLASTLLITFVVSKSRHAQARERHLQDDLLLARQVQGAMRPAPQVLHGPLEVASHVQPSPTLDGDFLVLSQPGSQRYGLLVGDVCGSGIQAALTGAMLDGAYNELARAGAYPGMVVLQLNRLLVDRFGPSERLVTLACLEVDFRAGLWRYCRAGHPPPLLVRHSGEALLLEGPGLIAGVLAEPGCQELCLPLQTGDQLMIVTDGLVECALPEEAGSWISRSSTLPIVDALSWMVELLRQRQSLSGPDDESAVLVRVGARGGMLGHSAASSSDFAERQE